MINTPKCECFTVPQEDGVTRGARITDTIGLELSQTLSFLMKEAYVCRGANDYVLAQVVAGLLLLNVSVDILENQNGVTVEDMPRIEAAGRAVLAKLPEALVERLAIIEKSLRDRDGQGVN